MNNLAKFARETSGGRILIPIGILLSVFGVIMLIVNNNTKNYIKTEAVVSKVELAEKEHDDGDTHYDTTYHVYVKYKVDDKEYEEEFGIFPNYKEGDKITILYNPKKPSEISQPINSIIPFIIIIGGVALCVVGIISFKNAIKKQKKLKLQEEGWNNGN